MLRIGSVGSVLIGSVHVLAVAAATAHGAPSGSGASAKASVRQAPGTLAALCRTSNPAGRSARLMILSHNVWRRRADLDAGAVRWSLDGSRLIAWAPDTGAVWALTASDNEPPWKVGDAAGAPALSPDGASVACARPSGGIALADLRSRTSRDLSGAERGYAPSWHPDGQRIAFARSVGGSGSVWMIPAVGGGAERIAVCAKPVSMAWSSDGGWLAIIEHDPDRMVLPRLSILKLGDTSPTPICDVRGSDVRWLGNDAVLIADPSGAPVTVSIAAGRPEPLAARDERALLVHVCAGPVMSLVGDGKNGRYGLRGLSGEERTMIPVPALPDGLTVLDACWTAQTIKAPAEAVQATGAAPGNQSEPDRAIGPPVAERSVVTPMVFPVCGPVTWTNTFGHPRGPTRRHAGQDLMAPKMRPVVAAFDGVVTLRKAAQPGGHNWLILIGDNGWTATYLHLNNDTPGTDDGLGTDLYAFAPGLATGDRVRAGQFLGYVGDSGNAEDTAPHLHFELAPTATRIPVDPGPSLEAAERLAEPRTFDRPHI
ncbi:MAG: peptidoglycan DD-metalloendopeptidase family protein [Chthonomonadales bacterium]|nr:peptidoglycan DD-metalloendopeptidase family protein [Chthonomonadales bacterium]